MEKKSKVLVYLPRRLYVEVHERQLTNHVSYLVSRLLEEFLKATDVRISWVEMESKAEQRGYLEEKLKEFLSRSGLSTEPPKLPVQEKPKQTDQPSKPPKPSVQSPPTYVQEATNPESVKEKKTTPPEDVDLDYDLLKKIESFW
jgi:hypothetical protein